MKNVIRLNEENLHRLIEGCVKKILKEHEEDWFDEGDSAYIGRTKAYYADVDDGSVYAPDYWTYDTDPNCADFVGEVYELSEEGKSELNWWIRCQRMNSYQRGHSFGVREESPEQEWQKLTSSREYSRRIR